MNPYRLRDSLRGITIGIVIDVVGVALFLFYWAMIPGGRQIGTLAVILGCGALVACPAVLAWMYYRDGGWWPRRSL